MVTNSPRGIESVRRFAMRFVFRLELLALTLRMALFTIGFSFGILLATRLSALEDNMPRIYFKRAWACLLFGWFALTVWAWQFGWQWGLAYAGFGVGALGLFVALIRPNSGGKGQ